MRAAVLVLALGLAGAARAQEPAGTARAQEPGYGAWEAAFALEVQGFTVDSAPWSAWVETTLAVERVVPRGSLRLEGVETRRFGAWDATLGADAWADLWSRAYGNARLEVTPDAETRPALDLVLALYQGVGGGWEVGGGWQRRHFDQDDVDAWVLSAARYLDGWYLRAGAEVAALDGRNGVSVTGVGRWYFDPPEELVEVGAAWGESSELVGPGPAVALGRRGHGHVRLQIFPWPYLGLGLSAQVLGFEDLPVRHGVAASLLARW